MSLTVIPAALFVRCERDHRLTDRHTFSDAHLLNSGPRGFIVHIALNIPDEGLEEEDVENYREDFLVHEWEIIFVRE